MKYILLCGGIGKRNNQYSLPKPLNYIHGRHLIEYTVESIPSNEIFIIYNSLLDQYNFKEILINKFKERRFHFHSLDFLSRGAVETALIGVQQFELGNDNVVFIDNDNVHQYPEFDRFECHFICYGKNFDRTNFSFIRIHESSVVAIEEKTKISDNYCCGIYGFNNKFTFIELANDLINRNMKTKQEFYFSQLYKLILEKNERITPVFIENTFHLGTFDEISQNVKNMPGSNKKMRICFDLDNTLLTFPTIPNDYSSVKPISKMIDLLNYFRLGGHEIIIHTARRMQTHGSNIGRVVKDIAMVTFQTLEKFNIHYDEIIFGKPIADIYIDDRALNPYYNDISLFGFFKREPEFIPNMIENNKFNSIEKHDNIITKIGPAKYVRGELFFYQNIPDSLSHLFPRLHEYNKIDEHIEIKIDFVHGIPLYFLYSNQTMTTSILDKCFDVLNKLHTCEHTIHIDSQLVLKNYINKLKERFNQTDYYFTDAESVFKQILDKLTESYDPTIVSIIHGDFWFSNIMLTYQDEIKCLDMRGQVSGELTLNGDMYYDYGKLYQSILGYDLVLHGITINTEYVSKMSEYFLTKCGELGLNIIYLKWVTKSLIFGNFFALKPDAPKEKIWALINSII
uniref:Nucleotidyl transferase domain-containing protein n=1 Tax=viral metagenome TaxID=1070528 RepID=A0A6C0D604_9ZZZZ